MKKKLLTLILSMTMVLTVFAGCGESTGTEADDSNKPGTELTADELEDGNYYIRHGNGKFSKLYVGKGSLSDGSEEAEASSASNDRVLWYKKDFKYIPTLYAGKGDQLIYYSKDNFEDTFNFERFYDLGYSVGIRGLQHTDTGRYLLTVGKDENTTYPNGDTDKLLDLVGSDSDSEDVIVDAVAGQLIRFSENQTGGDGEDSDSGSDDDTQESQYVTQWATIKGLKRDAYYKFSIYKGTIRKLYKFKADVRLLGSAESCTSTDYVYDQDNTKIIRIGIPTIFNDGYYFINTGGVFRYVQGTSYDASTNFNTPNQYPEDSDAEVTTSVSGQDNDYDVDDDGNATGTTDGFDKVVPFQPQSTGTATFTITLPGVYDESSLKDFKAAILLNDGQQLAFQRTDMILENNTAKYQATVDVTEGSTIQIGYSGVPSGSKESLTYSIQQ